MANKSPLVLNAGAVEQLQSGDGIIAAAFASSGSVVLSPSGTGGVQVGTGGNARGNYAVDLQAVRAADTQVASGNYSVALGGRNNAAAGTSSSSVGGSDNTVNGSNATIAGGASCVTAASYDTIVGSNASTISSATGFNSVVGGRQSQIESGAGGYNAIIGGLSNKVLAATTNNGYNVISGGANTIKGYACVAFGEWNEISSTIGIINGGVLSGGNNKVYASRGVVAGGRLNEVNNVYACVGGGYTNDNNGDYSTIPGGRENYTSGYSSIATGFHARATRQGQHAHAAGKILNNGDAQTSVLIFRNQTSDANKTELFLDGVDDRLILPPNTSWAYRYQLIGRCTSGLPTVAVYGASGWGVIDRDGSNNTTLLHAVNEQSEATPQHWIDADDTNESLKVSVNGEASCYFSWVCTVWLTELTGTGTDQQAGVVNP